METVRQSSNITSAESPKVKHAEWAHAGTILAQSNPDLAEVGPHESIPVIFWGKTSIHHLRVPVYVYYRWALGGERKRLARLFAIEICLESLEVPGISIFIRSFAMLLCIQVKQIRRS